MYEKNEINLKSQHLVQHSIECTMYNEHESLRMKLHYSHQISTIKRIVYFFIHPLKVSAEMWGLFFFHLGFVYSNIFSWSISSRKQVVPIFYGGYGDVVVCVYI